MSVWFDKKKFLFAIIVWLVFLSAGSIEAADRRQELMEQAQMAILFWDLGAADEASKELLRLDPKSDAVQYLGGVVAFFAGDYPAAQKFFQRVKNLDEYEQAHEGLAFLTDAILAENVAFEEQASSYVRLRFQEGRDRVMVPFVAEGMEQVRERVGKAMGYFPPEPTIVEIYPSSDAFIAASPLTDAEVRTSGTIALCKYGRILITTPRSLLRGYPWMDTISHEYVHFVLTRKWGRNIPVWLHEGIAKYFEGIWRGEEPGLLSPSFENLLAEAVRKNQFVTFEQMHPSFAKLPSAKLAQLAYAQAATFVDFLVTEKGGWSKVSQVLDEMAKGLAYDKAFSDVMKKPPSGLLEEWKTWIRRKGLKEIDGLDPRTLQIIDSSTAAASDPNDQSVDQLELSQIPSATARDHVHLGDLLRYRGRVKAAIVEYERAQTDVTGVSPIVATKLGLTYQMTQEYSKAETVLNEMLVYYPDQGLAHQILGDISLTRKQYAEAEAHYIRALQINPFNPHIHNSLVVVYEKLGQKKKVKRQKNLLKILR